MTMGFHAGEFELITTHQLLTGACSSACFFAQPTRQCPLLPRLVILTSK